MSYGELKIDTITFTAGGVDTSVSVSGLVQNPTFTGNITTTGTISGDVIKGNTVSGTTVTGDAGEFSTITGNTAGFTTVTGTTVTGTTANFVTVSGTTVTGTTANFVTVSGTTVTGTTANFVTVSGTTVTGNTGQFTNITGVNIVGTTQVSGATITGDVGLFSTITGGIHTLTSGVFESGTAANPSITFVGDLDSGIYSSAANEVAISTSGTGRLFVDSDGNVGIGMANPGQILDVSNDSNPVILLNNSNTDNSSARTSRLVLGIGSTIAAGIRAQTIAGVDASDASLGFSAGGDATYSKMRILANGNVGIGTTSPSSALEINAAAATSPFIAKINNSEAARIDSSGRLLVGTASQSGGSLLQVNDDRIRIASSKTPTSASDTGTAGEICWDSSYIYVCTATNTWKRAALSTW